MSAATVSPPRPPMTVTAAAAYLGLNIKTVRAYCRRGLIAYSSASPRKWLLDRSDVETFVSRTK